MPGPRHLVDWPWVTVEVECSLCPRAGRYRLARLAERYGAAAELGPLLFDLAQTCRLPKVFENVRKYEAQCGVRYRVPLGGPLPEGLPVREVKPDEKPVARRPRRRGPEGPLPTVGDTLASGPQGVLVCCLAQRQDGRQCQHRGRVELADIKVPREMPYVHIPRSRVLRCSRCGSRDVNVMPDWPSPQEVQARRMSGGAAPVRVLNGVLMPIGDRTLERTGGPTALGTTPPP